MLNMQDVTTIQECRDCFSINCLPKKSGIDSAIIILRFINQRK